MQGRQRQNLNALLARNLARVQRYREALSDLAHSLKTPLAVLRSVEAEAAVSEQAERMERAIAWHVQRAATAGRTGLARAVAVTEVVERVAAALDKVHADTKRGSESFFLAALTRTVPTKK